MTKTEVKTCHRESAPKRPRRPARRSLELMTRLPSLLFGLLFGLLAGAPFGCGKTDSPVPRPGPTAGGTLRVLHEFPRDLDPVLSDDVYETTIGNQVYEGLVRMDKHLTPVPSLASSWVISEDGLRYEFELRPSIAFHNGESLDAQTVVESLARILRPSIEGECIAQTYLEHVVGGREYAEGTTDHVEGLRVLGPLRLQIELEEPLSFFLSVLTMDQARIVPRDPAARQSLTSHPVGTGPFRFVERRADDSVVLARHDGYWSQPALLDSLVFLCERSVDAERTAELFMQGAIDVSAIAPDQRRTLAQTLDLTVTAFPELAVDFIGVNHSRPPLDNLQVRRAVAHAIDREGYIRRFQEADLLPATGVLPPGMPGYLPEVRALPFDLDLAREALAKAGYGPENPTPEIVFNTTSTGNMRIWLDEDVQPLCASIGLTLRIEYLPWPELDRRLDAAETSLFSLGWVADVPDPDGFLYHLFRTGEPNNLFGYSNVEVDVQLATARMLPPGLDRLRAYRAVEARAIEDVALIPLFYDRVLYAWNPHVRGFEFSPYGLPLVPFAHVWFDEVPSGGSLAGASRDSEGRTP